MIILTYLIPAMNNRETDSNYIKLSIFIDVASAQCYSSMLVKDKQ